MEIFLKRPNYYIENKIKISIKKKFHKKKNFFCTLLLSEIMKLKNLTKNLEIKINQLMFSHFLFTKNKNLKIRINKEREIYIGDIIVNINKINEKKNIKNFKSEFDKLWIHGLVHLLGYDHKKKRISQICQK